MKIAASLPGLGAFPWCEQHENPVAQIAVIKIAFDVITTQMSEVRSKIHTYSEKRNKT